MSGGEYEPKDSRHVTGEKGPKDESWRDLEPPDPANGGELEPVDSRNVTGTASTPDGRWTNRAGATPRADGSVDAPKK
jgi:hypothetical protein